MTLWEAPNGRLRRGRRPATPQSRRRPATIILLSLLLAMFAMTIPVSLTQTIGGIVRLHSLTPASGLRENNDNLFKSALSSLTSPVSSSLSSSPSSSSSPSVSSSPASSLSSSALASLWSSFPFIGRVSAAPFKINKNTVDMLNKGLTTLIGIKRLLTTIRSVNELSLQAFPALASKPRIGFIMKLINGGKLPLPHGASHTTAQVNKRNPSLGLIKIGEKPPPGLFPETMPFNMNGNSAESTNQPGSTAMSSSPTKSVTLSPIELFAQLGAAAVAATSGSDSTNKKAPSISGKKKRPLIITKHNIHEFQQSNNNAGNKPFFEGTYEVFQNPHV